MDHKLQSAQEVNEAITVAAKEVTGKGPQEFF
jgi:hypothetical protein